MATLFQEFVNRELPKRLWIEVPGTGNLESGKYLRTTGTGLQVELVTTVTGEIAELIKTFNCASSAAVDDVVFHSNSATETVVVNSDNKDIGPSIGIITNKPTSTTCKVLLYGSCSATFSGLTVGKKVYVSSSGVPTATLPTTGYVQVLGMCYENNKIFVNPTIERIKRNPF